MKVLYLSLLLVMALVPDASGQALSEHVITTLNPGAPPKKPGEAEFLVAPGGGAFEVPVRTGEICILTFPDELTTSAIRSSDLFEVKSWNKDSVAVRALPNATTSTLAVVTQSGVVKVNVTLRVVGAGEEALTLVRFRAVSAEEAFEARLTAEVAKRVAPLQAKLDERARELEETIAARSARAVQDASLLRAETLSFRAHARNDQHVIAHVERALLLGDDAYVFFELENRSPAPYRLARAQLREGASVVSGEVRLRGALADKAPAVLGVVRAGTTAHGVVLLRGASKLRKRSLTLAISDLEGRGAFEVSRGISLP